MGLSRLTHQVHIISTALGSISFREGEKENEGEKRRKEERDAEREGRRGGKEGDEEEGT